MRYWLHVNASSDPESRMGVYDEVQDARCTWMNGNIDWMKSELQDMDGPCMRLLSENADRIKGPAEAMISR